jgi:hypothetical protein
MPLRHRDPLGVEAGAPAEGEHPITGGETLDRVSYLAHHAATLEARHLMVPPLAVPTSLWTRPVPLSVATSTTPLTTTNAVAITVNSKVTRLTPLSLSLASSQRHYCPTAQPNTPRKADLRAGTAVFTRVLRRSILRTPRVGGSRKFSPFSARSQVSLLVILVIKTRPGREAGRVASGKE